MQFAVQYRVKDEGYGHFYNKLQLAGEFTADNRQQAILQAVLHLITNRVEFIDVLCHRAAIQE